MRCKVQDADQLFRSGILDGDSCTSVFVKCSAIMFGMEHLARLSSSEGSPDCIRAGIALTPVSPQSEIQFVYLFSQFLVTVNHENEAFSICKCDDESREIGQVLHIDYNGLYYLQVLTMIS